MPIYEYQCRDCSAQTERFFRSYQASLNVTVICDNCRSKKVERQISRVYINNRRNDWATALDPERHRVEGAVASSGTASQLRAAGSALDHTLNMDWEGLADQLESGDWSGTIEIAPPEGFPEPGPDAQLYD